MAKSKKKKSLPPRVKRLKRQGRLQSAKNWIPTFTGKNLIRGYCNHYGVDWRCAVLELKTLGVQIDPDYIEARERADAELAKRRQIQKDKRDSLNNQWWHPFTDTYSAYLAGDFAAHYDLEMREKYGDGWEQLVLEPDFCDATIDDEDDCGVASSEISDDFPDCEPDQVEDSIPF